MHNGLRVLNLLYRKRSMRFGQILEATEMSKPTLSAALAELCESGFARKTDDGYRLGSRILVMAQWILTGMDLRAAARSSILLLRDRTQETAELAVCEDDRSLIIDKRESVQSMSLSVSIGSGTDCLFRYAHGMLMLAYLPDVYERFLTRRQEFVDREPNRVFATPVELREMLPRIRRERLATGEVRPDVTRVCSPIFNNAGEFAGSIGIAGPEKRIMDRFDEFAEYVREAAQSISENIGGTWEIED